MPMSFGTSCEPREETPQERKRRKRKEWREAHTVKAPAFQRIVDLCAVRDRSVAELREKLEAEEYEEAEISEAIQRGLDCNLLDNARFADALVRGRVSAGKGEATILHDLERHGINPESLEGWPEAYGLGEQEQLQRALDYLNNHPPKAKDAWAAAYRKLISRGYSSYLASKAARQWMES